MLQKILIVFNPKTRAKYTKKGYYQFYLKSFNKYLPKTSFDWLETTPNLVNQLKELDFKNFQRIIAIGGDGTVKEVADYLLTNGIDLPLAIIPTGSANVLASSLAIPLILKNSIKTACLGQEKKIDVCLLNNERYFLICLSLGYWSNIVKKTKRGLKIYLGFWAYVLTFLRHWKVDFSIYKFKLDNKYNQVAGNTLIIANALSLLNFQPRTPVDFFDGKFEILIPKNKSHWGFAISIFNFFLGKKSFPLLFKAKGKKIVVDFDSQKEKTVQIDGEMIEVDKIEVELIPKKLTIIT